MDRLFEAVDVIDRVGDWSGVDITSIELDDRSVRAGALYCCIPGHRRDGHDFAPAAARAGAAALLVERPLDVALPQAVVGPGRARPAMAEVARTLNGDPAAALVMAAVTGTNGKTTVTHMLASMFDAGAMPSLVIGTLGGARTTPEAPQLQRMLADARHGGTRSVAMEVSSHALVEHRVDGIVFDVAAFTNLSQDHLDFHRTMDDYFAAKARLFTAERTRRGVVNADDPWGQLLIERGGIELHPYSSADAGDVQSSTEGTSFTWRGRRLRMRLPGAFQVANALCAATAAHALGLDPEAIEAGLEAVGSIPGRFEVVETAAPFTVVVDYAHTPEALRAALESARSLAGGGRVLCVFGCGGERDRHKRPLMGAVAQTGADFVVVTSDNSRSENPSSIIDDVLEGMADRSNVVVEPDRRAAVALAVDGALPGDVVLVAGKGHETTMEAGGVTVSFDDRLEVAAAVARRTEATP